MLKRIKMELIVVHRPLRMLVTLLLMLSASSSAHADKVDDYVRQRMQGQHIPGLSLAVILNGKILKARGYGFANAELNVPATAETIYQIQSMTKQFTATSVMMLVEQGKIVLDEPLSRYLDGTPEIWKSIKIRHLLTHTSGLKDYINEPSQSLRLEVRDQDVFQAAILRPLNFQPGERFEYCNTNYHLLGMIIHKLTGAPYGEFLKERIFEPLGMTHTRIMSLSDLIPKRASGYLWDGERMHNGEYIASSVLGYAGGSILTNVLDMAKWDAALSGERLLKSSSLQQMWTSGTLNDGSPTGYGFGWGIGETNQHPYVTHSGGHRTGFTTVITRYLKDRLTLVVLTNQMGKSDPTSIATGVAANYLLALLGPTPKTIRLSPASLEAYTGRYEVQNNVLGTVTAHHGRLQLTSGGETWELLPTGMDAFFLSDPGLDPLRKVRLTFREVGGPKQRLEYTIDSREIRRAAVYIGPFLHSLKLQSDHDPAFAQKVWAILKAMSQGGKAVAEVQALSPGARTDFAAVAQPELAALRSLNFISMQDVSGRGIERHGSVVSRILYYKLRSDNRSDYLLIYMTADGLVTDEDVVDD